MGCILTSLTCEFAPPQFFLIRSTFFIFFLFQIFRSISLQFGHIWYQNGGNEMFYHTIRFIFTHIYSWISSDFFFIIFRYIFCHSDLDLWPEVTNFYRIRASAISNYLAKTASKLVHSFGWTFVHKKRAGHTHTQTNCSENIIPPRFHGGVTMFGEAST